jgi:acylphosphatase
MSAARFIVGGKVQGVWFRAATREQALRLGICGYAKNLPDGRVEVVASGSDDAVATLERWLSQGPPLAKVSEVKRQDLQSATVTTGFDTL